MSPVGKTPTLLRPRRSQDSSKLIKKKSKHCDTPVDFTPHNLVYKNEGESVTITAKEIPFQKFVSLLKHLYYDDPEPCPTHDQRMQYTFEEEFDVNSNTVSHFKVVTQQLVGKSPERLATLTAYPSTHKIHIQGNADNVLSYISNHFTQLMLITNTVEEDDLAHIKCVECFMAARTGSSTCAPAIQGGEGIPTYQVSSSLIFNSSLQTPGQHITSTPRNITTSPILPHLTPHLTPATSPSISKARETTLLNQVLNRLDQLEEIIANKSVIESRQSNRIAELQKATNELQNTVASQESTLRRQNDLVSELSSELNKFKKTGEQLWKRAKEAECANTILATKLDLCYNELAEKSCKCTCERTTNPPIPAPRKSRLPTITTDQSPPTGNMGVVNYTNPPTRSLLQNVQPGPPQQRAPPQNVQPRSPQQTAPRQYEQQRPLQQRAHRQNAQCGPSQQSGFNSTHVAKVKILGDSNLGRAGPALLNTIPGVKVRQRGGYNFHDMLCEVAEAAPSDVFVLSGGVNDASQLDDVEMSREPIRDCITIAKRKSKAVVVMPPPPLQFPTIRNNISGITEIMRQEAHAAGVEFVDVSSTFPDPSLPGPFVFHRDGLHVTKLGGGLYAHALLNHLYNHHNSIPLKSPLCVLCHRTGHIMDHCQSARRYNFS